MRFWCQTVKLKKVRGMGENLRNSNGKSVFMGISGIEKISSSIAIPGIRRIHE